jgi:hypothetical protein
VLNYFACNGNERKACIETGFAPSYATELFRKQQVKDLIEKLRPEFEKELIQKVIKERQLSRDFLDLNLMNVIANGETHLMRGDADKVKAIEIGYKAIGDIQPTRIVANAQAGAAVCGQGQTFLQVYKSAWLIKKEEEMARKCEQEYFQKNS